MVLVAERVASCNILNSDNRGDIARVARLDVFAFVGLNLNYARNPLTFVRARIVNSVAFAERAGINAEEYQFADKRIAPQLERNRTKRAVGIGHRFHWLARIGVLAFRRRNVERAWQVIDNCVDQILNSDVLESRAANHWHEFICDRLTTNAGL